MKIIKKSLYNIGKVIGFIAFHIHSGYIDQRHEEWENLDDDDINY